MAKDTSQHRKWNCLLSEASIPGTVMFELHGYLRVTRHDPGVTMVTLSLDFLSLEKLLALKHIDQSYPDAQESNSERNLKQETLVDVTTEIFLIK